MSRRVQHPLVHYYLNEWVRYCRKDNVDLGYPKRSIGLSSGGESQVWDDWQEQELAAIMSRNVKVMDTLISDLLDYEREIIEAAYLNQFPAVLRRPRIDDILQRISDKLLSGMMHKNII